MVSCFYDLIDSVSEWKWNPELVIYVGNCKLFKAGLIVFRI